MRTIEYTVGDTSPSIAAFLTLKSTSAPDPGIATATITFNMWGAVDGVDSHLITDGTVTLADATTGYCIFTPESDDLEIEGDKHRGRFTMTHADGRVQHYPSGRSFINILVRRP